MHTAYFHLMSYHFDTMVTEESFKQYFEQYLKLFKKFTFSMNRQWLYVLTFSR